MAEIEFAALANHAEARDGLLFLSGVGWTEATLTFPPELGGPSVPFHFGIGVSVLVGWTETNRPHRLRLVLESEDGGEPLMQVDGEIQIGRPVGIPDGSDQRTVLAFNGEMQFPAAGGYRLKATLDGGAPKTASFRVRDANEPFTVRAAS